MEAWYKKHQALIWIVSTVAVVMAYAFTTFATVNYVDQKHNDEVSVLNEIKADLKDTRDKVYQLNGEIPKK